MKICQASIIEDYIICIVFLVCKRPSLARNVYLRHQFKVCFVWTWNVFSATWRTWYNFYCCGTFDDLNGLKRDSKLTLTALSTERRLIVWLALCKFKNFPRQHFLHAFQARQNKQWGHKCQSQHTNYEALEIHQYINQQILLWWVTACEQIHKVNSLRWAPTVFLRAIN